jgi:histidine triad (HIT) family protein
VTDATGAFDPTCAFCRIARGRDSSVEVVCEGNSWVAFFPPEPATPGHTLVIPRQHVSDVWDLSASLGGDLMSAVVMVGRAIQAGIEPAPEGMNLISSSGSAAEQTVFHVHLHVVPRWRRDRIGRIWPPKRRMNEELKEDLADRIREACTSALHAAEHTD